MESSQPSMVGKSKGCDRDEWQEVIVKGKGQKQNLSVTKSGSDGR